MAKNFLKEVYKLTLEKFKQSEIMEFNLGMEFCLENENEILQTEYNEVEQVLPMPG